MLYTLRLKFRCIGSHRLLPAFDGDHLKLSELDLFEPMPLPVRLSSIQS